MKKSILASAIALSLGSATSAQALTITITSMNFNGVYSAAGTMNDAGTGSMSDTTVPGFFGSQWTADQQNWFNTTGANTWSGTGTSGNAANAYGDFTYNFSLTANQVAAGTFFDWGVNDNIPVLTIYDCGSGAAGACVGSTEPMATAPFAGQSPQFLGSTAGEVSAVPVPAAVWLMGSGLLGLVGVARRRKVA